VSADPTTWGCQEAGFVAPIQQEIIDAIQDDQRALIDPKYDIEADSPNGQNVGIFSRQLAVAWENVRVLHDALNRDNAEDERLVNIGKLTGTAKYGPWSTKIPVTVTLATGTLLEAGVSMASMAGKPDVLFTPTADYTATEDGSVSLVFESIDKKPIAVPPGTLTVIATPTTGWTSITNATSGVLGSLGDTNASFRTRQEEDLARAGSSTARAISVDVETVKGVIRVSTLENTTDHVDANGLPPHSIECVVYDDGTVVSTALAQAIDEARPAGVSSSGSTMITYVDSDGETIHVFYTPITAVPIWIRYVLQTGTGYVGDDAVKAYVVEKMILKTGSGDRVLSNFALGLPFDLQGVLNVAWCGIGTSESGVLATDVWLGPRSIATFSTSRIDIS
jgi:hypothetical protein